MNYLSILLFVVGFEIVYKIGKAYIFYELGKYLAMVITVMYLFLKDNLSKAKALPFILILILFLPGIFVSSINLDIDPVYLRKIIIMNSLGPILLVFCGILSINSSISKTALHQILLVGLLPAIVAIAVLFTKVDLGEVEFNVESNTSASGGFGANQVSTALGFYATLIAVAVLNKIILFKYQVIDFVLLLLVLFRGFLTFSRGGIATFVISVFLALLITSVLHKDFRVFIFKKYLKIMIVGICVVAGAVIYVNYLTNNLLYYRYMGYGMNEIIIAERTGKPIQRREGDLGLSNRDKIMAMELESFDENLYTGTGIGLGKIYRERVFGFSTAPHTEYTRLIGEQGIFGILILLVYLGLAIKNFNRVKHNSVNLFWFVCFFVTSLLIMFHSATRLSLSVVTFAISFISITPSNEEDTVHR